MRKIKYDSSNNIFTVDSKYDYDRSFGSEYYRGIICKCEEAEERIVNIINYNNFYKIINNEDMGLHFKIRNLDIDWNSDESPLLFEKRFISDCDFKQSVLKLINDKISENKKIIVNNELNNIIVNIQQYSLIMDKIKIIKI